MLCLFVELLFDFFGVPIILNSKTSYKRYSHRFPWAAAAVVSAAPAAALSFTLDGKAVGLEFREKGKDGMGAKGIWAAEGGGLVFACTFQNGQAAKFNFGQTEFMYPPPKGFVSVKQHVESTKDKAGKASKCEPDKLEVRYTELLCAS